jgi:hypothetical protein
MAAPAPPASQAGNRATCAEFDSRAVRRPPSSTPVDLGALSASVSGDRNLSAPLATVEPALEMHRYCDSFAPAQVRVLGGQPSNVSQHRLSLLVRQYRDCAVAQRIVG